jgi:hypothetical protein
MINKTITFLLLLSISNTSYAKKTSPAKTSPTVFTKISNNRVLNNREYGKDNDCTQITTNQIYIEFLQNFLKTNNIKSVVDAGCGNFDFSQKIDWHGIHYIEYDVFKSIVKENCIKSSNKTYNFIHDDITTIDLPSADLLLCKDVLQHLPNKDVIRFLKQCSKFKHCLITNDIGSHKMNKNIKAGEYRPIDLTQKPFNITGFKILTYKSNNWKTKQVLHISPTIYNPSRETSNIPYNFTHEPIDVVIPCAKKDRVTLDLALAGILSNSKNIHNIFVISAEKMSDKAIWIDEQLFPFTKKDIALQLFNNDESKARKYLEHKYSKIGWIYQQLLKFYAAFIIQNISKNILVLDADTIFLRPVEFQDDTGAALFNPATEYHAPYFEHAKRVISGFRRIFPYYSGISHHMLFQKSILIALFHVITETHKTEPWIALIRSIASTEIFNSCLSEYEIYFNFAFATTNQVKIRYLKWANISDLSSLNTYKEQGYHYVSCHTRYQHPSSKATPMLVHNANLLE